MNSRNSGANKLPLALAIDGWFVPVAFDGRKLGLQQFPCKCRVNSATLSIPFFLAGKTYALIAVAIRFGAA
jgi:hypothetical protein